METLKSLRQSIMDKKSRKRRLPKKKARKQLLQVEAMDDL